MTNSEKFRPTEANLGNTCVFWNNFRGCTFPKAEMIGRVTCEGIIDDVCLYRKDGRIPPSLTEQQIFWLKTQLPSYEKNKFLPPGDIKKD